MAKKEQNTILNFSLIIIMLFMLFYVLYIGSSLIIPFIIALLFSFAIIGLSNFFKGFKIPAFISFILSLSTYIFIFWLIGKIIGTNVAEFNESLPVYQEKIIVIAENFLNYFPESVNDKILSSLGNFNIAGLFTGILDTITSIFSSTGIILFYVMFILLEYRYFKEKLNLMITDKNRKIEVIGIIEKIKKDVKSYFVIKTMISLGVGLISYLIMASFGLNFAIFWAFLIFILNFIPNIGSIIAVTFPVLFSLIQFGDIYTSLFLLTFMVSAQIFMGNFIEPQFMGNKLNLSPLVIIIALAFWGTLWGIVGMLLSVPIMVIINIILAKIPATRSLAILLSEKGELQVEGGEEVVQTRRKLLGKIKGKFKKKGKK